MEVVLIVHIDKTISYYIVQESHFSHREYKLKTDIG